jgi:hypothetical protein
MSDYAEYELAKLRQAQLRQEAALYRQIACGEPLRARLTRRLAELRHSVFSLL